jgi:transposase
MRVTTLLRRMLGVPELFVRSVGFQGNDLIVGVVPRWRKPRCGRCGRPAAKHDRRPERRWRHLGLGRLRIWLSYAPRRVGCRYCEAVCVEQVPWAPHASRFTSAFEELTAYLAQITDKTKVTELMGISWRTVGKIVERVVARNLDPERLEGLPGATRSRHCAGRSRAHAGSPPR